MKKKNLLLNSAIAMCGALSLTSVNAGATTLAVDTTTVPTTETTVVEETITTTSETCPVIPEDQVAPKLEETKIEVEEDKKAYDVASTTVEETKIEVNSSKEKLEESNTKLENAKIENKHLIESKDNTDVNELKDSITTNTSKISDTEKQISETETQISTIEEEIKKQEVVVKDATTNLKEATDKLTATQTEISNIQDLIDELNPDAIKAEITKSQTFIDELNKSIADAQVVIDNLKNSVIPNDETAISNKEAKIAAAQTALNDAIGARDAAQVTVDTLQTEYNTKNAELTDLKNSLNYVNKIVLPDNLTYDLIQTQDKSILDPILIPAFDSNKFIANPADEAIIIEDFSNLSDEVRVEINKFATSILNGVRRDLGLNELILSEESIQIAKEIGEVYYNQPFGHHADLRKPIENAHKIDIYGENLWGASWGANNLAELKQFVYYAISDSLFRDSGSNYGHLNQFVSAGSWSSNNGADYFGLSTYKDSTWNYNNITFGVINDDVIWPDATFNTSPVIDVPSNDTTAIENQIATKEDEVSNINTQLGTATTNLNNENTNVTNITSDKTVLEDELSLLKNKLENDQNLLNTTQMNQDNNGFMLYEEEANLESLNADLVGLEAEKTRLTALLNEYLLKETAEKDVVDNLTTIFNNENDNLMKLNLDVANKAIRISFLNEDKAVLESMIKDAEDKIAKYNNISDLLEASNKLVSELEALKAKDQATYEKALEKNKEAIKVLNEALSNYEDSKHRLACLEAMLAAIDDKEEPVKPEETGKPEDNKKPESPCKPEVKKPETTCKPEDKKKPVKTTKPRDIIIIKSEPKTVKSDIVVQSSSVLPSTGSVTNPLIFDFGSLSTIAGLGMIVFSKKKRK